MIKQCSKCRVERPTGDFYKNPCAKDGLNNWCRFCFREHRQSQEYKKRSQDYNRQYRQSEHGKERRRVSNVKYYRSEARRQASKRHHRKHREQRREYGQGYRQTAGYRKSMKKYAHSKKGQRNARESMRRRRLDPVFRLNQAMSRAVRDRLVGRYNNSKWWMLGYNLADLKQHIEQQFVDDMTWENYGDWHVDHKIPISAFNYSTHEHIDFKRCWAIDNLQPMWAKENMSKGAQIDKPFQPSLEI